MYPNFGSFYASGLFIVPKFYSFCLSGCLWHPSVLLSSQGSGVGMQLPPKIGPLAKTLFLASSLSLPLQVIRLWNYVNSVWKAI